MDTNYATPIATYDEDTKVPVADFEAIAMLWVLRSLRPQHDGFTTLSFAIQKNGKHYHVVERVDGGIPADHCGHSFEGEGARDSALDYWSQLVRGAVPPCAQGALPGFVGTLATYIETYTYYGDYGGAPCARSHARVGAWT